MVKELDEFKEVWEAEEEARIVNIGGIDVELTFVEENQVAKYIDLDKFETGWHEFREGEYHFSALLYCLKHYWFQFNHKLPKKDLISRGTFYTGNLWHREIQDHRENTSGFSVIERPLIDEFKFFYDGEEITIFLVGKADMVDIKVHKLEDIKTISFMPDFSNLSGERLEQKIGKYIIQVLVYTFYFNHTYFSIDPIERITIIVVNKTNAYIKEILVKYEEEKALFFYKKIRARAKYLHDCILKKKMPNAETNQYCYNCTSVGLCEEGMELKMSLERPLSFESNLFESKNKPHKAYYKRDGEWKQTKGFIAFLEKQKGVKSK